MARSRSSRRRANKKQNPTKSGTAYPKLRSDLHPVEFIRAELASPLGCVSGRKVDFVSLSAVHGQVTVEELKQLRKKIDEGELLVNNIRALHGAYLVDGQKPVEGRPYELAKPWPRWIGHVTNTGASQRSCYGVRDSIRHPRTHQTTTPRDGKMRVITNSVVVKQQALKHNVSFEKQLGQYKRCGATRPQTGYPKESLSAVVLYSGEMSKEEEQSDEVRPWLRGFNHSWKTKAVLVFGTPIMGVRGHNGHGLINVSKKLAWWGILACDRPNEKLTHELRRRLAFLYDVSSRLPQLLRSAIRQ